MAHRIKSVKALEPYKLSVVFQNGIEKEYDVAPLLQQFPTFRIFETDQNLFEQIKVDLGGYGVYWNDSLDLDGEDIWEDGIETGRTYSVDGAAALSENLVRAREAAGMTQKRLAEETGIYQADISRIERGLANPSLSTLERLAEGMGMKVTIDFKKK